MRKSGAVRGLTVGKYFDRFYDTGRRFIGFSPATVDEYLSAGAMASLDAHVVTLRKPDGTSHVGTFRLHSTKIARWVNDLNERARGQGHVNG